jgi:hypothetical protein
MYAGIHRVGRVAVRVAFATAVIAALALPAAAQESTSTDTTTLAANPAAPPVTPRALLRSVSLSHFRPHDARALAQFEPPKPEGAPYTGFRLEWGAAFTQQFQGLRHENNATPNIVGGVDLNQLITIGSGFNNADANLYMDAQLARGIRVALTSYLSSRHHNETWVKDGYLLVDGSPWENATLDRLMDVLTLKVGHFEINYGDMHFRRSDNGQTMFNPLVGNLIMDAFTTEIGGEVYGRKNGYLGMVAVTGGEVRGTVLKPENRSPSVIGKLGFDKTILHGTRVRLTGSVYTTHTSNNNTLYSGSRAGSRYYYVLENVNATENAQAWSGDLQPGFSRRVTAWVVNPFVQCHGVELFGNVEQARGRNGVETSDRTWTQYAGDGVYRFLHNQLYVAARYNQVKGRLVGATSDVTIDRTEAGGGWFLTSNLEAKIEYVQQNYRDYPLTDIHHDGKFHGVMVEAAVSF